MAFEEIDHLGGQPVFCVGKRSNTGTDATLQSTPKATWPISLALSINCQKKAFVGGLKSILKLPAALQQRSKTTAAAAKESFNA